MRKRLEELQRERQRLNDGVLAKGPLGIKRFFALDERAYDAGVLDAKTKELIGLATSMALRCDDCITHHATRCAELGASDEEMMEAMGVALVVGGSVVIPHLRRAVDLLDDIRGED